MMISMEPGKYVVAVSGGVDSVVLLDLLNKLPGVELVVAHFDHGIRPDSAEDRQFVRALAATYDLPFESAEGRLGAGASEATARAARYDFLEKVRRQYSARAIVTAHHADDMLETAIINLLRGTGRKGMSSLASGDEVVRPLLNVTKQDILEYAKLHGLEWREDATNQEEIYLRNYIRRRLLPRFSKEDKQKLLDLIEQSKFTNQTLDSLLTEELSRHSQARQLDKRWLNQLPHKVALEIMASWLREQDVRNFDSRTLERLVVAAKTARAGQQFDVLNGVTMSVSKGNLALDLAER